VVTCVDVPDLSYRFPIATNRYVPFPKSCNICFIFPSAFPTLVSILGKKRSKNNLGVFPTVPFLVDAIDFHIGFACGSGPLWARISISMKSLNIFCPIIFFYLLWFARRRGGGSFSWIDVISFMFSNWSRWYCSKAVWSDLLFCWNFVTLACIVVQSV